jgi:hypothetical protein
MKETAKKGSKKKRTIVRLTVWGAIVLIAAIFIIIGIRKFLPVGLPDGGDYFKPVGERTLLPDEQGQFNYVYRQYDLLDATGDTFGEWDPKMGGFWRYAIAFASYGMPSLMLIDPADTDRTKYLMGIMITKMKSKKVWKDWVETGFGDDPITRQNIMYKGHLNLMYGLYQLTTGDTRFAGEYTWLTNTLVAEIRENHASGRYEGVNCEPDRWFVQCNSIGLMSLLVYDKLYGTKYAENEGAWVLDFIHGRMTDPETGLYYSQYHPINDFVEKDLSGYTNAWSIVMLRALDPDYNEKLYPAWKKTFVVEKGPYAFVSEVPGGAPSGMATMFGMWAAKEYGDEKLFTKLRNAVDKTGGLREIPDINAMMYANGIDNTLFNGPILSAKLHVGMMTILDHDWGHPLPYAVPDVSGMTWKDVLPQEIHGLTDGTGTAPLPPMQ